MEIVRIDGNVLEVTDTGANFPTRIDETYSQYENRSIYEDKQWYRILNRLVL